MRPQIKVNPLFRILSRSSVGSIPIPVGDLFPESEFGRILSNSIGESVIDVRTRKKVYVFDKESWSWIDAGENG